MHLLVGTLGYPEANNSQFSIISVDYSTGTYLLLPLLIMSLIR